MIRLVSWRLISFYHCLSLSRWYAWNTWSVSRINIHISPNLLAKQYISVSMLSSLAPSLLGWNVLRASRMHHAHLKELVIDSFQAVTFTSTEQRYTPWVGDWIVGFNYAHAIIQNCLALIWNSVRRVVESWCSDSNKFPGEYVFDFAVVVFGVCTPSLLHLPYLTPPLSAFIILREEAIMQWVFFSGTPSSLLVCKCSICFLPWQFSLRIEIVA